MPEFSQCNDSTIIYFTSTAQTAFQYKIMYTEVGKTKLLPDQLI